MMKRLFVIFLATLYLFLIIGNNNSYAHFCKGQKKESGLIIKIDRKKACSLCSSKNKSQKKDENCCKYKAEINRTNKATLNQEAKTTNKITAQDLFLLPINLAYNLLIRFYPTSSGPVYSKADKITANISFYKLNCIYRI